MYSSVTIYGDEAWTLKIINKIKIHQREVTLKDCGTSKWIRDETKAENITKSVSMTLGRKK